MLFWHRRTELPNKSVWAISAKTANEQKYWRIRMKRTYLVLITLMLSYTASAQTTTLGSTMDVFIFPSEGQDSSQQSKDEAACYDWAFSNTGVDPFDLEKKADADEQQSQAEQQAAEQVGQGSGARGAVRGAAAGALIGEIANDDASNGAAWGAAAGVVRGRRSGKQAQNQAQQQAASQSDQREEATAEQLSNFKKAFSVCLEAKEYMVKY
jgi:hypothetical protein